MNTKDFAGQLKEIPERLLQYKKFLFLVLVLLAYIFVVLRVGTLSSAQPTQAIITKDNSSSVQQPEISQATVSKITQLQNNSVSVQALFNQARQDPFQE